MAQLSVPTSLNGSADLGANPFGILIGGSPVEDPATNPVLSDPPSTIEMSRTGASDMVDAVDDTSEAKFWSLYNTLTDPVADNSISNTIVYNGQTLTDPGVDTDHNLLLLLKRTGNPPNTSETIILGLYSQDDVFNPVYFDIITGLITQDLFALIEIPLSAPQVQDFRSKNGYLAGPIFVLAITSDNDPDTPLTSTYELAYIALEVPESGGGPTLELTGNVTVDISLNEETALVEVEIDASGIYQPSDVTSNITIELDASGIYGQNIIDGNVTLEINATAIKVLSTDPSGLYVLESGKRNDTIYLREQSEATVDVEIPDPFIKTAYFGG